MGSDLSHTISMCKWMVIYQNCGARHVVGHRRRVHLLGTSAGATEPKTALTTMDPEFFLSHASWWGPILSGSALGGGDGSGHRT